MRSLVGSTPALFRPQPGPAMSTERFRGAIPADRLYDPRYDMWLMEDGDQIILGATSFGLFNAGKIIAFTAKPNGAEVDTGRSLGTVECAKTVLAVHAPVAFVLKQANTSAEDHPDLINRDPYGQGWMVRGRPRHWPEERATLVDADTYRRHVLALAPDADIP